MTPEDIRRIVVVEELDLSADGRLAVVVRRSIKGDRYHGHLFAIDLDRRDVPRPRQLTRGAVRDTWPRLCSDGRTVAFVRTIPTDEDTPARIALLDLERPGHPVRFVKTGDHGAVVELAWSPDGRRLAFTAEVDPPRFIVGPTTPVSRRRRPNAKTAETPSPRARRITRTDWRWDGEGHRDRWSHLFVVDWGDGRPRQVTSGDWGVSDIAWHPDGRSIAFTADRGPDADLRPRTTIWAVDVDGAPKRGARAPGSRRAARDPRRPAAGRTTRRGPPTVAGSPRSASSNQSRSTTSCPTSSSVRRTARARRTPWTRSSIARSATGRTRTSTAGWSTAATGRHWVDDRRLVATVSDRGRVAPARLHDRLRRPAASSSEPWPATGDLTTHTIAVAAGTAEPPRIAFLATNGTQRHGPVHDRRPRRSRIPRRRSTFGSAWQDRHPMPEMRRIDVPGPAGPIDTWIASPPGAGDERPPHGRRRPRRAARRLGTGSAHRGHPARRRRLPRDPAEHPRLGHVRP